jgi:hypothetical protein
MRVRLPPPPPNVYLLNLRNSEDIEQAEISPTCRLKDPTFPDACHHKFNGNFLLNPFNVMLQSAGK